jgi:hypothetical protein
MFALWERKHYSKQIELHPKELDLEEVVVSNGEFISPIEYEVYIS